MNIHIREFQRGGAVDDAAALEQFQKQWATYQKLVDTDALSHREVGAILHDNLAALPKPFAFLDIDRLRRCRTDARRARRHQGSPLSRH